MPKRKRNVTAFVVNREADRLFVRVDAIMPFITSLIDGIPLTYFEKDKHAYLPIEKAVEWVERECELNPAYAERACKSAGGREILEALQGAKRQFESGKMEIAS